MLTYDAIRAALREGKDSLDLAREHDIREADVWNILAREGRGLPGPEPRRKPVKDRVEPDPHPVACSLADRIAADRVVLALRRPDGMTAGFIAGEYRAHLGRASEALVILAKRGFGRIERRAGGSMSPLALARSIFRSARYRRSLRPHVVVRVSYGGEVWLWQG